LDPLELFQRLGLALAIGLLIGTERGWREREGAAGSRTAGIRTYALSAMLGGVFAALVPHAGQWPLAFGALAFGWAFTWFQWRETQAEKNFSVTGVVAGLLTFALGAYAVLGDTTVAAAAGIAVVGVLASREGLHALLRKITWPELRAAIVLLAMTFLLLPVLPNEAVDPWGALNPYKLWLLTILIATVSFAGHIAVRVLGEKSGILIASAAGAMVSSTLVTLNNARRAREEGKESSPMLSAATLVAWSVSLARTVIIAASLNVALLSPLAAPAGAALAVLLLGAGLFAWQAHATKTPCEKVLGNPFSLRTVLLFGLLLAVVTLAAKVVEAEFHGVGLLPLAAIAGATDIDPITLAMADMARTSVGPNLAALAILVGLAANAAFRAIFPVTIGGSRFGVPLAIVAAAAIGVGALAWFVTGGHTQIA
jgi:uncharacterized membrane protein (DUF4010 family)